MIIPREISAQDFDKILDLLDKTVAARLSELYEKDENDCARSFVLKENVEENSEVVEELVGICDKLLHKCFEGEKFLWTYFQPGKSQQRILPEISYYSVVKSLSSSHVVLLFVLVFPSAAQ